MKILIDFIGGTHGNFLEYVLNCVADEKCVVSDIFTDQGASHNRDMTVNGPFVADHVTTSIMYDNLENLKPGTSVDIAKYDSVIRINVRQSDLPILVPLVYERAGNANLRLDRQETIGNFYNLPEHRATNGLSDHVRNWSENSTMSSNAPGVDVNSIRELLKFAYGNTNGILLDQSKIQYPKNTIVSVFEFNWFYDKELFVVNTTRILKSTGFKVNSDKISAAHSMFLDKNSFKDVKKLPEYYFSLLGTSKNVNIELSIYQEAYLDFLIEQYYKIETKFLHDNGEYFVDIKSVDEYIKEKINNT